MSTCLVSTWIGMQDIDNMAVVLGAERHQLANKVIRLLNVVGIVQQVSNTVYNDNIGMADKYRVA